MRRTRECTVESAMRAGERAAERAAAPPRRRGPIEIAKRYESYETAFLFINSSGLAWEYVSEGRIKNRGSRRPHENVRVRSRGSRVRPETRRSRAFFV